MLPKQFDALVAFGFRSSTQPSRTIRTERVWKLGIGISCRMKDTVNLFFGNIDHLTILARFAESRLLDSQPVNI